MSNWRVDNQGPRHDVRERIAGGTIGGEHTVPGSIGGRSATSIVDDADPRIDYGSNADGAYGSLSFTQLGTQTVIGDDGSAFGIPGSQATLAFIGTSIGVMGSTNPYSGRITVTVDGVVTPGRLPVFVSLHIPSDVSVPAVAVGDTTINTLAIPAAFPASGQILLGNEIITYSAKSGTSFTVSPVTKNHYRNETVYLWGSSVDLGSTDYGNKRLLYYNPFLANSQHTITITSGIGTTGYGTIYFDGFITGSLIGSQNLFVQTGTITKSVTTDGNGHAVIGNIVSNNSDVSIVGVIGYSQSNTETSNTTILGQVGLTYSQSGEPSFYLHNGPISATFNVIITFSYIGESLD